MKLSVLDTSACAAVMRRDDDMAAFLHARAPGSVALVPPVVAEIEFGIRRLDSDSRKRSLLQRELQRILDAIRVLEWTAAASSYFGEIKAQLERAGTPIDDMDVAIAAVAAAHDAEVITANVVHFSRVTAISTRHW